MRRVLGQQTSEDPVRGVKLIYNALGGFMTIGDRLSVMAIVAIILSIPFLNGLDPARSQQKLASFHIGPVQINIGYIK